MFWWSRAKCQSLLGDTSTFEDLRKKFRKAWAPGGNLNRPPPHRRYLVAQPPTSSRGECEKWVPRANPYILSMSFYQSAVRITYPLRVFSKNCFDWVAKTRPSRWQGNQPGSRFFRLRPCCRISGYAVAVGMLLQAASKMRASFYSQNIWHRDKYTGPSYQEKNTITRGSGYLVKPYARWNSRHPLRCSILTIWLKNSTPKVGNFKPPKFLIWLISQFFIIRLFINLVSWFPFSLWAHHLVLSFKFWAQSSRAAVRGLWGTRYEASQPSWILLPTTIWEATKRRWRKVAAKREELMVGQLPNSIWGYLQLWTASSPISRV